MFHIDERINTTCFVLGDWPLSRVLLKNEQKYPWLILVPRKENVQEIFHLEEEERQLLIEEVNQLSLLVNEYFSPDKLNIGTLGNIVSQLHIHVVARKCQDLLWPQGIWQSALSSTPYEQSQLQSILVEFGHLVRASFCKNSA